jgi:peptidylprolyl isomerase
MSQAKQGDTVKVHYKGTLDDGSVFDCSDGRDPLEFRIGAGQIIPGFENAVVGMTPGDSKTVTIPSDEAYGPHREELILMVDPKQMPDDLNPEVGQQLQIRRPDEQMFVVTVTDISESGVTLDANHPLAGKDLTFEVNLLEIVPS